MEPLPPLKGRSVEHLGKNIHLEPVPELKFL